LRAVYVPASDAQGDGFGRNARAALGVVTAARMDSATAI